jgi:hypothetical protein
MAADLFIQWRDGMNAKKMLGALGVSMAATCLLATAPAAYAQMALPDAVKVPDGHKVAMQTVGVGEITYECRDKPNAAGQTEWTFVGPKAVLNDRSGKQVGTYFGPPATWQAADGSKVTGTQVAVAPAGSGDIPYQLVKANPAEGKGGVAPKMECSMATKGKQEVVKYQADYIFWAAQ